MALYANSPSDTVAAVLVVSRRRVPDLLEDGLDHLKNLGQNVRRRLALARRAAWLWRGPFVTVPALSVLEPRAAVSVPASTHRHRDSSRGHFSTVSLSAALRAAFTNQPILRMHGGNRVLSDSVGKHRRKTLDLQRLGLSVCLSVYVSVCVSLCACVCVCNRATDSTLLSRPNALWPRGLSAWEKWEMILLRLGRAKSNGTRKTITSRI